MSPDSPLTPTYFPVPLTESTLSAPSEALNEDSGLSRYIRISGVWVSLFKVPMPSEDSEKLGLSGWEPLVSPLLPDKFK